MKITRRSESGELMIETMLVMIPTLFILIFLIALGFLLYQEWNIQITADDVVSKVSQTYGLIDAEIGSGKITKEDLENQAMYRYTFVKDTYKNKNKERVESQISKYLRLTDLAKKEGTESISYEVVHDNYGRRHIKVKLSETYRIPFGEGLEIFGMDSKRTFSAISSAECQDLSDYMNSIDFAKNSVSMLTGDSSDLLKAVDSVLKLVEHVKNYGN